MDLLERYLYDVGRRLPAKQREDIEKELRSLLLDALEARTGGEEPSEQDVIAMLRDFGEPADVAGRYTGNRCLIGPRLYPTYKLVLGIVLAVLAFGLLVSFTVGFFIHAGQGGGAADRLLQLLLSLVSGMWSAVGAVTVIFWGIERGMEKQTTCKGWPKEWDPKTLQPVPVKKHAWKPADSIVAIVFTLLAVILFNAFPQVASIFWQGQNGQWQSFPILSAEALATYLPLWNIGWALGLILHVTLLVQGRWSAGTRLAHIGTQIFSIAVLCVMIAGPVLFSTAFGQAGSPEWAASLGQAFWMINRQLKWILALGILGCAVDIGMTIYRIVTDRK